MRGIRIRHVRREDMRREDMRNFIKSSKSYGNNTHNCKKRHEKKLKQGEKKHV